MEIGTHTRYGEILPAAIQRGNAVIITGDKPPIFIKGGLHSKLVMPVRILEDYLARRRGRLEGRQKGELYQAMCALIEEISRGGRSVFGGLCYHFWTKAVPKLNRYCKG